ncbi:hypothetical protein VCHA50P415_30360 [Vibrio chagasii]|nr:hypothetical protein VCHA34O109_160014 [Vibrio chagasii]CAH6847666.1 hypothetical protein VCHA34P117_10247 [Vibrio chagasii]CAH6848353.1 hypothetical protein VCHA36P164_10367 [Vibrio chagasii]CAH6854512.1 hypothetical protein VCHA29O39_10368 [Vibrio chagasii]CAH6881636.1 hypothetical protein VCHA34P121_20313 [Vibrio chagasii]
MADRYRKAVETSLSHHGFVFDYVFNLVIQLKIHGSGLLI